MPVADLRKVLGYDPSSGNLTWLMVPHPNGHLVGTEAGRMSKFGYRRIKLGGRQYAAHRLAWYLHTGEWPTRDIDHINCDRSDNRRENLRLATVSQNAGNRQSLSGSSSRFKGVTWNRHCQKWQAQIKYRGVSRYLGLHDTEEAASSTYQRAAVALFGEFARAA